MKIICRTCKKEFEGESWKIQCYDCYKKFKGHARISLMRKDFGKGVLILSHPDCTKEEIDKWIEKTFGSVNNPSNWGAVEVEEKMKIWWNCQNDH